jgi:hypothetical protein
MQAICFAQNAVQYNLNMHNGMPSNHVYQVLVDHYGYLWMTTPNGVVRYNGYEMKTFDISKGLPNNDVWDLFEDRKGRIWLSSFSYEIGYIYKDRYKKVVSHNENVLLSPKHLNENKHGVLFASQFFSKPNLKNEPRGPVVYLCANDTLFSFSMNKFPPGSFCDIDYLGDMILAARGVLYKLSVDKDSVTTSELCKIESTPATGNTIPLRDHSIFYNQGEDFGYVLNVNNCDCRKFEMKKICGRDEKIVWIYTRKDSSFWNYAYIITKDSVYKTDTNFHCLKVFCIKSLAKDDNIDGSKIACLYEDSLWGTGLTTSNSGYYLNFREEHFKKTHSFTLSGYKYVGQVSDDICYWWNNDKQTLLVLKDNKPDKYITNKDIRGIKKMVKYNEDSSVVLAANGMYWFDNATGNISFFFKGYKHYIDPTGKQKVSKNIIVDNIVIYDKKEFYTSRIVSTGFSKFSFTGDAILCTQFDYDRYFDLVFDSVSKSVLAYTQQKIFIYRKEDDKENHIPWKKLVRHGITEIEQLVTDNKYGNVFIKDYEKLFVVNVNNKNIDLQNYTELLKNYRLNNSSIHIYKDKLIVAGIFGVLFCRIEGPCEIGKPIVYQNIKGIDYNNIDDVQISDDTVLLKTDAGLYAIGVPSDEMLNKASGKDAGLPYKFLFAYNDDVYDASQIDTIFISQKNWKLHFDIINPRGNGTVSYSYQFANGDSSWHDLNSNELDLSHLGTGRYYDLSVAAHDDVWQTDKINLHVYIIPYWWQKPLGRNLLWLTGIMFVLLLVVLIVFITKRIVTNSNTRRNLKLELELKSVYSQINPHFIFNALSSVMYFIKKKKMDAAYTHVQMFSRLLRAYIKSSRKRYITLAEEIVNLRNYIELQLARFEDRFDYEINVDEQIDTQEVNIPSLLLQPIVENAINHGLFHKEEKGHLKIEFKMNSSANEMVCIIDDDGIGRESARKINENSVVKRESYGDQLIKDLINVFNQYERIKIEIAYVDKTEPLSGTTVILRIKNIFHEK